MGFGHHHHEHPHSHGGVDHDVLQSQEATKALMISLIGLFITASLQAAVVVLSGSVALLADAIHNFGDALTSIPLWFAFRLSRRLPTKQFSYGLNRSEDIAGLFIVFVIMMSGLVAGYESIMRIMRGVSMNHLGFVAVAAVIGFAGNEIVAIYRIRMGKKMGSAALITDGKHARIDGVTSLAVLIGVIGAWLGYPMIDPIVGLVITVMILFIVKNSAKEVFTRILDGIEPEIIDKIVQSAMDVDGVLKVLDVKARWFGHQVLAELTIAVDSGLSVKEGHQIAQSVIHQLQHEIEHLSAIQVHVDPLEEQGQFFHTDDYFHRSDRQTLSGKSSHVDHLMPS